MKHLLFILFMALAFAGCKKEPTCGSVDCLNGGVCLNNTCYCPTGYGGQDCGTVLTPVSVTITRIEVSNYPVYSSGSYWDFSTDSDPFVSLSAGGTCYSSDAITGYYYDAYGQTLGYNVTYTIGITQVYALGLWDYDSPDPSDYMCGVSFAATSHKSGYPSSFTVYGGCTAKIFVTWNF